MRDTGAVEEYRDAGMDDPLSFHHSALVIDGHADTPQRFADEGWDFLGPLGDGHLNLAVARAGGLDAEFFAIWVEPKEWLGRFQERAMQLIRGVEEQLVRHPDTMRLCRTAAEVRQAKADGVFAVLLGMEGGHAIENSLAVLRQYFERGVRYMTLTWANSNGLGRQLRRRRRPGGGAPRRPDRLWPRGRARDEPAGDDGGREPRVRRDVLGRAADEQGAGDRIALQCAGVVQARHAT